MAGSTQNLGEVPAFLRKRPVRTTRAFSLLERFKKSHSHKEARRGTKKLCDGTPSGGDEM